MSTHVPVLIVGGGISGLVSAYALRKAGVDAQVVEAGQDVGGVIRSQRTEGYLLEWGPQSFSETPALMELIRELKLEEELVAAPDKAARFVLIDGKLKAVPLSPPAFIGSSLFSFATKWSFQRDAMGRSKPPAEDESIATFTRRKFTDELLEKLVGPMVSGIYAGDPEQLSLRAAFPSVYEAELTEGSIIRGMKKKSKNGSGSKGAGKLLSFREGNQTLPQALAKSLGGSLRTGLEALRIRNEGSGSGRRGSRFVLEVLGDAGLQKIVADKLIMATSAEVTTNLLEQSATEVQGPLREITYAPMAVLSLGYDKTSVGQPLDGFGFLAPRSAGVRMLGCVWNSSLFPNRAPEGKVLLTCFLGGATDPEGPSLSNEELLEIVHKEIGSVLKINGTPAFSHVLRYPHAIPQYNLGHTARIERIERQLVSYPNLWLAGNYINGPSVGACVEQALEVARQATK